jgi:hypothetical protein
VQDVVVDVGGRGVDPVGLVGEHLRQGVAPALTTGVVGQHKACNARRSA